MSLSLSEELPVFLEPMLAKAAPPPTGDGWCLELKYDGIRGQLRNDRRGWCLRSRPGHDRSSRFPELEALRAVLGARRVLLDGEVVVFAEDGRPDFSAVRAKLAGHGGHRATFVAFDLLHLDGSAVRRLPLRQRQALLRELLGDEPGSAWCVARPLYGHPGDVLSVVAEHELEGVIAKRLDSTWQAGRRSSAWLKHKLRRRLELAVTAWRPATDREPDTYWVSDMTGRSRGSVAMGLDGAERTALREAVASLEVRRGRRQWRPVAPGVVVTVEAHGYEPGLIRDAVVRSWSLDDGRVMSHRPPGHPSD